MRFRERPQSFPAHARRAVGHASEGLCTRTMLRTTSDAAYSRNSLRLRPIGLKVNEPVDSKRSPLMIPMNQGMPIIVQLYYQSRHGWRGSCTA